MAYFQITRPEDVLGSRRVPRRTTVNKGATLDGGADETAPIVSTLIAEADAELTKVVQMSSPEKGGIRKMAGADIVKLGDRGFPIEKLGASLQSLAPNMGVNETQRKFVEELGKMGMNADIIKEITTGVTSGVSGTAVSGWTTDAGPWIYDLEAPAKNLAPVLTPLRNKIPRIGGVGTSKRFRRILGISGSQTGGIANLDISMNEATTESFRGTTLNRPKKMSYATDTANVLYRLMGVSDDLTWAAQFASAGFQTLRGMIAGNLLRAHMMGEEQLILHGRNKASGGAGVLTAPSTAPTATGRAAVAPEVASSFTGTTYVATTFLGHFGESALSPVYTLTGAAAKVYDVTPGDAFPTGALGFRVYAGTVNGPTTLWKQVWQSALPAGGLDYSGGSVFIMSGTALTAGTNASAPNAGDTGTASNDQFDGMLPLIAANGGVSLRQNPIANSTNALAQPLTLDLIQKSLLYPLWVNNKADPEELWVNALESIRITDLVLGASGTPYRVTVNMGEEGGVTGGYRVSRLMNKITSREIAVTPHPYLEQGNIMAVSYNLPIPNSEVPAAFAMANVQDYMEVDWPQIQMSHDASTFQFGALIGYANVFSGVLQGIQPA